MKFHTGTFLACLALLSFFISAGHAENLDLDDLGPLRIRDQFLLGMGFLAFDPDSADVLPPGHLQIDLVETVTNTFANSNAVKDALDKRGSRGPLTVEFFKKISGISDDYIFQLDGEVYRTLIAYRYGLGKGWQAGIQLPFLSFNGGKLDSLIEEFHDTFGLGQHGRLGATKNAYSIYLHTAELDIYNDDQLPTELGDITLSTKYDLLNRRESSHLSLEAIVKVPTGRDNSFVISSGSFDSGLQILYSDFFSRSCIHASFGVLQLGKFEELKLPAQTIFSGMVGVEHGMFNPVTSFIVQVTVQQSPFRRLGLQELSEISIQSSLGLKCAFGREKVLFIALTENLVHYDNTADIGFHLGWTQRL